MPKLYALFREDEIKKIEICCQTFETLIRLNKWSISGHNIYDDTNLGDGDSRIREFFVFEDKRNWRKLNFCYGCAQKIEFLIAPRDSDSNNKNEE